jgi:hypothetical protein
LRDFGLIARGAPSSSSFSICWLKRCLIAAFVMNRPDEERQCAPKCVISGGFDRSMQHHLKDLLFKDGVYDPRKTVETFCHAENRYLESMEVRAVVA